VTGKSAGTKPCCSVCGEPAVIFQRHTGRHLCRKHLGEDIEERVAATIRSEKMIVPGDHVTIALSGGKDSTALLMILSRILSSWDDVRLSALTIDEGIAGYREDTIRAAERLVRQFGLEHHNLSFSDLFPGTLDTLLKGRETEACSICGILRRKALIVGGQKSGATKLATGHNLDDEAQSVLMNVLRGDLPRLVRNSGVDSSGLFIPRIKPLMYISEKEIATYLMVNGMWEDLPECPYARYALRREVRTMLGNLEYRHPGTMLHLMESKKKIETRCAGMEQEPIRTCRECGDPCSGETCQLCQLQHSFGR
jgi:uncharacterized protein (TIGR00269 family)